MPSLISNSLRNKKEAGFPLTFQKVMPELACPDFRCALIPIMLTVDIPPRVEDIFERWRFLQKKNKFLDLFSHTEFPATTALFPNITLHGFLICR